MAEKSAVKFMVIDSGDQVAFGNDTTDAWIQYQDCVGDDRIDDCRFFEVREVGVKLKIEKLEFI